MNNKFLFKLAESEARPVYAGEKGIFSIDSAIASDDYKKTYDAFVYDLHDSGFSGWLRNFFNRQYSMFFSVKPGVFTKIFSFIFVPSYRIKKYGSILDVGCSTGLFLRYLPDEWIKYGIELNTRAVAIARGYGLNIQECGLESFKTDIKFDVIRASHVIEHVKDYKKFLSVASDMLKSGGLLVICTPNGNSFARLLTGRYWSGFYDKTHFTIFNTTNLREAAQEFGLESGFEGTYYMGYLGDSILRMFNIKKGRSVFLYALHLLFFPLSFIERVFGGADALVVYLKKIK